MPIRQIVQTLPLSQEAVEPLRLVEMYTTMVRIRAFEERLAVLVEAGQVTCPCHLYIGQEAVAAGVCAALEPSDTVWGGHRSHGHYLAKGGDPAAMMAEIFCRASGCASGRGGSMHLAAPEVGILGTVPIVAGTVPLAVGAALAARFRDDRAVAVAFFGDGAVEEGHVHESINLAAVLRLPVIFICENNFYSSHLHLLERRVRDNLHEIGEYHGVPGLREDGNNVVAVHAAARRAVDRARAGGGPTFIEFRTFRWRGHVGASWDMDVGLRRNEELQDWLPKDPIAAARKRLQGLEVPESLLESIESAARLEVEQAVDWALQSPAPADHLLEHVFTQPQGELRCEH